EAAALAAERPEDEPAALRGGVASVGGESRAPTGAGRAGREPGAGWVRSDPMMGSRPCRAGRRGRKTPGNPLHGRGTACTDAGDDRVRARYAKLWIVTRQARSTRAASSRTRDPRAASSSAVMR